MNLLESDAQEILAVLNGHPRWQKNTVILAPGWLWPFMAHKPNPWGVQNFYPAAWGAFTGELSLKAAQAYGAQWALVGHSERRQGLGESNEWVARKLKWAISQGFRVILCVGETLGQRQAGLTEEILKEQLSVLDQAIRGDFSQFESPWRDPLTPEQIRESVWVAYEPVWAIGTGLAATPPEIERTLKPWIYRYEVAGWLYGGSVSPENVAQLAALEVIDGVLVGSVSLTPQGVQKLWQQWELTRPL